MRAYNDERSAVVKFDHWRSLQNGQHHEQDRDHEVRDVEGRVVEDFVGQLRPPALGMGPEQVIISPLLHVDSCLLQSQELKSGYIIMYVHACAGIL